MKNNKKILIKTGIGILAVIAIATVVLISGGVEEKPADECISGDGTCSTGCNYEQDTDCESEDTISWCGAFLNLPLSTGEERYGESRWAKNNEWFFDKRWWETYLNELEDSGYTALAFAHSQPFPSIVKFKDYPEANALSDEELNKNTEQLMWIFSECHKHNISTYIWFMNIFVSQNFADAHEIKQQGVRSPLTAKYTSSAVKELLLAYDDLDGLIITLAENVKGNPTTWFKEGILPGIQESGKHPHVIVRYWVFPYDGGDDIAGDFKQNVVPAYDNLWFQIKYNMEMVAGTTPDPIIEEWQSKLNISFVIWFFDSNKIMGSGLAI